MDEKSLNIILVIVSIVSLIILYFSFVEDYDKVGIKDINENLIGKRVFVKIEVENYKVHDGNIFITPKESNITIVFFNAKLDDLMKIEKNKEIFVKGRVEIYKGNLEIIASEILNV